MKKFGFTLAEVLVTLGIIGVISALVLPTFTSSTQRAKIGPKLAKAVSVFEQATQAVLDDAESDSILGAQVECRTGTLSALTGCFSSQLEHHLKGSANGSSFVSSDGVSYSTTFQSNVTESQFVHDTQIADVTINTSASTNGSMGSTLFKFHLMDDGTLIPWGSSSETNASNRWQTRCPREAEVSGTNLEYCAGHVMENNLKVEYKIGRTSSISIARPQLEALERVNK